MVLICPPLEKACKGTRREKLAELKLALKVARDKREAGGLQQTNGLVRGDGEAARKVILGSPHWAQLRPWEL